MRKFNILVACEESQTCTKILREMGHIAWSCDLQECSGGKPEWHIKGDVTPYLLEKWDLVIAHPPCTYLSHVNAPLIFNKDHTIKNQERYEKALQAAEFFYKCYNANADYICVENPIPIKCFNLPRNFIIIQPWQYALDESENVTKATCLWTKNLWIPLPINDSMNFETDITTKRRHGSKQRSKSFYGISKALCESFVSQMEMDIIERSFENDTLL